MKIKFDAAADADVSDAYNWYELQEVGLGEQFLGALQDALKLVTDMPTMYPVIDGLARRCVLRRFPYSLYYRVEQDTVRVIACFHGNRDPIVWRNRIG
ncbi:MAG TPA: type II toxin-antitoxin system RelE/ParE family toxin [Capsulimonadaceae bacterium]|jgi:plasmid stabilization system protein ParE